MSLHFCNAFQAMSDLITDELMRHVKTVFANLEDGDLYDYIKGNE